MKLNILLAVLLFVNASCHSQTATTAAGTKAKNLTVIELFTSEGCSSCPPAEKYLGNLSKTDSNIVLLSFHVDYWNRLGWTDTFSSNQFTQRQYDYGNRFNLSSVYTPQAIVNGTKETTGGNANKIQQFIEQTQTNKQGLIGNVSIKLQNNNVMVTASTINKSEHTLYEIFLVEKKATTHVKSGENRNVILEHTNVVRSFTSAASISNIQLPWKAFYSKDNFEVVVIARDSSSFAVKDVLVKGF